MLCCFVIVKAARAHKQVCEIAQNESVGNGVVSAWPVMCWIKVYWTSVKVFIANSSQKSSLCSSLQKMLAKQQLTWLYDVVSLLYSSEVEILCYCRLT